MKFWLHSLKQAYGQMGNTSFCWIFLSISYLLLTVGFSFSSMQFAGYPLSRVFAVCFLLMMFLSILTFALHYIFLYKITLKNKETSELKLIRHAGHHGLDRIFEGWIPHCDTGPAVRGFDAHRETKYEEYYFEGQSIKAESFKAIYNCEKSKLNQYLTSKEPVERAFADYRVRCINKERKTNG